MRNPGDVLRQLNDRLQDRAGEIGRLTDEIAGVQQALLHKKSERDLVVGLFRRGRIGESALDHQLDQIDREETELRERIDALEENGRRAQAAGSQLRSAEDLLRELNRRLDGPLTWELKRPLVEALVESIMVNTVEREGRKEAAVTVVYRFDSTASRTGSQPWPTGQREEPHAMQRIPPSESIRQKIDEVLSRGLSTEEDIATVVFRAGVERLVQELFEQEVRDHLGRERYQRREPGEGHKGYRNGYEPARIRTAELSDADEPCPHYPGLLHTVEEMLIDHGAVALMSVPRFPG